jgi:hypothetical protein
MICESSILAEGARRVWRRQRIVWWIWLVNLVLAFVSAMPLLHRIGDVTDHSLAAQRLVNGFDWGTYSELLSTPDVNFGSALPGSTSAVLVFFVFMLFMTGGVLASYVNEYKLSTRDFFASCGAFFWRCVRLFLFLAVIAGAIMYGGHMLVHWGGKLINDAAGEKTGYWVALLAELLTLFVMMAVRLWFDMAQVRAVVEDERAMRRTLRHAFRLTFSNFGSLFWLYSRISFLAWLGLALGLWLWIRVSGFAAIIMFEVVLLWWVGTRMWQRACEVAWYQRFAIALAPVATVTSPEVTPQPAPITPTPDTLLPNE